MNKQDKKTENFSYLMIPLPCDFSAIQKYLIENVENFEDYTIIDAWKQEKKLMFVLNKKKPKI